MKIRVRDAAVCLLFTIPLAIAAPTGHAVLAWHTPMSTTGGSAQYLA